MATRSSSRLKHKLEDENGVPAKKLKTKTAKESPKAKKTKTASSEKKSGKKETTKSASSEKKVLHESSTLERGHIYFFYRPKVEHEEAHKLDDVQRLFMVLKPEQEAGSTPIGKIRLIVLTAKRLPEGKKHSRYWAFVEAASHDISDITKKLEPEDYETKTRGERHVEGCRPCGSGMYSIVHHLEGKYRSSTHTHIAYVTEVPEKMGEVQKAFQIKQEGSFIVTVKNPKATTGRGLGPKQRAEYPKALQDSFGTKKFSPAEPTALLDYNGAEMILIGTNDDIVQELGKPAKELEQAAEEEEEEEEKQHHDHRCSLGEELVFQTMHMRHKEHPAEPLLFGKWE
eukprot:Phypoly_transcript_10673.p1 GENE.Phypoly_transcript_10673~~Phypoly_transcript_10673.p1  ORF type:complete len:342 (+),score=67.89 Phypoly_transcript_10673:107-1132(+)